MRHLTARLADNYDDWTIHFQIFPGQIGVGSNPEFTVYSLGSTSSPYGAPVHAVKLAILNAAGTDQDPVFTPWPTVGNAASITAATIAADTWYHYVLDTVRADNAQGFQRLYRAVGLRGDIRLVWEHYGKNRGQPDAPAILDASIRPKMHTGQYKGGANNTGGNMTTGWNWPDRNAGIITTPPTTAEYYPSWNRTNDPSQTTFTKGIVIYPGDIRRTIGDVMQELRGRVKRRVFPVITPPVPPDLPATPTGVNVTSVTATTLAVSWTSASGATSYQMHYRYAALADYCF